MTADTEMTDTPTATQTEQKAAPSKTSTASVSRRVTTWTIAAIVACFVAIGAWTIIIEREALTDDAKASFADISTLLADGAAGGLRWNKAEAVEQVYAQFVTRDGSMIAGLRAIGIDGSVVAAYDSETLAAADFGMTANWFAEMAEGGTVDGENHIYTFTPAADAEGTVFGWLAIAWSTDAIDETVTASMISSVVALSIVLVVISAALALILRAQIGRPLARITDAMSRLARNELDTEVPALERRDDVGAMARAVQVFKENALEIDHLRSAQAATEAERDVERKTQTRRMADDLDSSVKAVVTQLDQSIQSMESDARHLTSMAERNLAQVSEAGSGSKTAAGSMQAVAGAIQQLNASTGDISRKVGEAANIANAAADNTKATNSQVGKLSDSAKRIGDVVSLISDIAEQTNLLALNATIEAARAGDAGKGFAVVAAEVKSLANQTARATQDIGDQIAAIQAETEHSVSAIESIAGTVEDVRSIAGDIAEAVSQQNAAIEDIVQNINEAANNTNRVSDSIGEAADIASDTGQSAASLLAVAGDLTDKSNHLQDVVSNIVATLRAA